MIQQTWDLKLSTKKIVQWTGETPEDAAERYTDCIIRGRGLDCHVVATRKADDPSIHVLGRGTIIG
jgi:hypothetical protein